MAANDMARIPIRIAIRAEGKWINAYFARQETMSGATKIGSIRRSACDDSPEAFELWKQAMEASISGIIKRQLGVEPAFGLEPAPEHERSGNA